VDRRHAAAARPAGGALRIVADGRVFNFNPVDKLPVNFAQRRELHMPKHDDVVPAATRSDPRKNPLHFLAISQDLTLRMPKEPFDTPFTLFEDGRRASRVLEGRLSPLRASACPPRTEPQQLRQRWRAANRRRIERCVVGRSMPLPENVTAAFSASMMVARSSSPCDGGMMENQPPSSCLACAVRAAARN